MPMAHNDWLCKVCTRETLVRNSGMCYDCYKLYLAECPAGPENERGAKWFANDGIDCRTAA